MGIKLSRYSLFTLAFITLINISVFYFREALPDNYFSISSDSNAFNFLSFYLTTFFRAIGFYLGPFMVVSFVGYLVCYPFFFKKSEKLSDLFIIFSIIAISAIGTFFVEPAMVGEGLQSFFNFYASVSVLVISLIAFSVIFVLGLSNWSFKNTVDFLKSLFILFKTGFGRAKSFFSTYTNKIAHFIQNPTERIFVKVSENLKGNNSLEEMLSIDEEEDYEYEDDEKPIDNIFKGDQTSTIADADFADQVKSKIEIEIDLKEESQREAPFEVVETQATPVTKTKKIKRVKKTKEAYLSPETLIESIDQNKKRIVGPDQAYFEEIISRLEDKLKEFKINAQVINVLKGPVVDTFELELGPGVKVSKVTGITEDLSLALSGAPIRMIFPLKGKTTMGIEVPRNPREIIFLSDVLKSSAFRKSENRLPIAMGKDAFGESKVVDLAGMPHMLVAGSTGAGKSVFINTLLVSLLVKLTPKQMKLVLIDPKQLELALYSKLPHLALPVMTEPKTASIALLWACQEMERRYSILKEMGVRNVEGFNSKIKRVGREDLNRIQHLYEDASDGFELPYIVIIVDEFADLILSKVGKDIEINICRLAAKARASGIHLVLATQRPSVDVITGLVKSNFPTRVSFRVSSAVDSRTILNTMGAEKLLGKGDMLFKQGIEMERLHSAYVDEDEIENLVKSMCKEEPKFDQSALSFVDQAELGEVDVNNISDGIRVQQTFTVTDSKDPLYDDAIRIISETKSASASFLQRRLKIGYNRAANLIEQLEANGAVGPQQGSKPRKVLI